MADETSGVLNVTMSATEKKTISLISSDPEHTPKINPNFTLPFGGAAGQIELAYGKTGTIAAGQDLDINLQAAIEDTFGDALSFTKVKAFGVYNKSHEADPVSSAIMHVGGGDGGVGTNALNGWITSTAADGTERVIVPAGGIQIWGATQDGIAIASGMGPILRLSNEDGGVQVATYQLLFLGT